MQGPRGPQPGATNRPRPSPRPSARGRGPRGRGDVPEKRCAAPRAPRRALERAFQGRKRRARARPRAPRGPAAAAAGAHPVPCRTRKLSPPAPEVLRGGPRGRKGRRRPAPRVWGLPSGGPFFRLRGRQDDFNQVCVDLYIFKSKRAAPKAFIADSGLVWIIPGEA